MEAEDVAYEIMDYMDSASEEDNNKALTILEQYANQKIAEALIAFQKGEIEVEESLTEKGKVTFLWGDKELEQKQK